MSWKSVLQSSLQHQESIRLWWWVLLMDWIWANYLVRCKLFLLLHHWRQPLEIIWLLLLPRYCLLLLDLLVRLLPTIMTMPTQIFPWSNNPKFQDGVSKSCPISVRLFQWRKMMCLINDKLMDIKHCYYSISNSIPFTSCFKLINVKRFQFKGIY